MQKATTVQVNLTPQQDKFIDNHALNKINEVDILEELSDLIDIQENPSQQSSYQEERRNYNGRELWESPTMNPECVVEPIFPRVGVVSMVGSSDTGKSMLLRQLAISIAAKKADFLGFLLRPIHNRSLMILTEDGPPEIKFLLGKQADGISLECLENLRFIFSPDNALQETETELMKNPVDVVIVDAWGDVCGVDTKDNGKVRIVLNEWHKLAVKYQCLIIFLHHTGKTTDNKAPSKHNTIGAQSFEAKVRCLVELRKDNYDEDTRHFCIVKGNSLAQSYKTESFVLDFDPETFLFRFTGARRSFEDLAFGDSGPKELKMSDDERAKVYISLKKKGLSDQEIAPAICLSDRSAVAKFKLRAKKNGIDLGGLSDIPA